MPTSVAPRRAVFVTVLLFPSRRITFLFFLATSHSVSFGSISHRVILHPRLNHISCCRRWNAYSRFFLQYPLSVKLIDNPIPVHSTIALLWQKHTKAAVVSSSVTHACRQRSPETNNSVHQTPHARTRQHRGCRPKKPGAPMPRKRAIDRIDISKREKARRPPPHGPRAGVACSAARSDHSTLRRASTYMTGVSGLLSPRALASLTTRLFASSAGHLT